MAPPKLSIVITCREAWPAIQATLDALRPQLVGVDAEVVIPDSTEAGLPGQLDLLPVPIRRLDTPAASPFFQRHAALAAARGDLIAITEEHAQPNPTWVATLLAFMDANPQFDAIVGPMLAGAPRPILAWVHHLSVAGRITPPLPRNPPAQLRVANSVIRASAYRAALAEAGPEGAKPFWIDGGLFRLLEARGKVGFVANLTVHHTQDFGLREVVTSNFHNARACEALRLRPLPWWAKPFAGIPHGAYVLGLVVWRSFAIGPFWRGVACLPGAVLVAVTTWIGRLVGAVAGPGRSPERVS